MKRLLQTASTLLTAFCVATIITQLTAVGAFWFKGALDQDRLDRVLAALHGEDVVAMQAQLLDAQAQQYQEQPSYDQLETRRVLRSLDLDLRESAVENGLQALHSLQTTLESSHKRFEQLKKSYDAHLSQIAEDEKSQSLREVQLTLESIKPKQAKEQIIRMIEAAGMTDVVTIMKQMSLDKRRKILAEFESEPEQEHLFQILTNIRQGEPLVSRVSQARSEMMQLNSQR